MCLVLWGKFPQLRPAGLAADGEGVRGIAWVRRFEKGKKQGHPNVMNGWGEMGYGKGVMTQVAEFVDLATDYTDEGANVAEFKSGFVRMEVLAEDVLQMRCGAS